MNAQIIKQYNITFQKKLFLGDYIKSIDSPHKIMNQFISDDRTIEDIDDTLGAINLVLDGETERLSFSSESLLTVDVDAIQTKFYLDPNFDENTPVVYNIPTLDFRAIVEAWKEYVQ